MQEAYARALVTWPRDGVPAKPGAWLLTVARNKALDHLRRERTLAARREALLHLSAFDEPGPEDSLQEDADPSSLTDDRLALMFTCCHPALAPEARVALTLRLLGGLTTAEIARAMLVSEPTMAARITRAKKKIRAAGIPFAVPPDDELPDRLAAVLAVAYLVFTEGHAATSGDAVVRVDLCAEAIRLARLLVRQMPDEPEVLGLLALMVLQHSRRDARSAPDGSPVLLGVQDRSRWDATAIAEGSALVERALHLGRPGPYQLQAAIAAVHANSATPEETDWAEVRALYAALLELAPSPIAALNAAVATAEAGDPAAALDEVDALADRLAAYHLMHAARGEFLLRLGRTPEAVAAFARALELAPAEPDRIHLRRRLAGAQAIRPSAELCAEPAPPEHANRPLPHTDRLN